MLSYTGQDSKAIPCTYQDPFTAHAVCRTNTDNCRKSVSEGKSALQVATSAVSYMCCEYIKGDASTLLAFLHLRY